MKVLDDLIAWAEAALERRAKKDEDEEQDGKQGDVAKGNGKGNDEAEAASRKEPLPATELLNTLAWWLALRGERLHEARALAETAVAAARKYEPGLFERSAHRRVLSTYVNTLGWVELLLGEIEPAIAHLREAVELDANGPNLLYLSWAYSELGRLPEARDAARKARARGDLNRYERRQLDHVSRELGLEG